MGQSTNIVAEKIQNHIYIGYFKYILTICIFTLSLIQIFLRKLQTRGTNDNPTTTLRRRLLWLALSTIDRWFDKPSVTRDLGFFYIIGGNNDMNSHLLPSTGQWNQHYRFHRLRSVTNSQLKYIPERTTLWVFLVVFRFVVYALFDHSIFSNRSIYVVIIISLLLWLKSKCL